MPQSLEAVLLKTAQLEKEIAELKAELTACKNRVGVNEKEIQALTLKVDALEKQLKEIQDTLTKYLPTIHKNTEQLSLYSRAIWLILGSCATVLFRFGFELFVSLIAK